MTVCLVNEILCLLSRFPVGPSNRAQASIVKSVNPKLHAPATKRLAVLIVANVIINPRTKAAIDDQITPAKASSSISVGSLTVNPLAVSLKSNLNPSSFTGSLHLSPNSFNCVMTFMPCSSSRTRLPVCSDNLASQATAIDSAMVKTCDSLKERINSIIPSSLESTCNDHCAGRESGIFWVKT